MHIKNVRVANNPRNVLVQIPVFISDIKWQLKENDVLEVHFDEDTKDITIRPSKLQAGGYSDEPCETVVANTDGHTLL